jgi:hypothetical protein
MHLANCRNLMSPTDSSDEADFQGSANPMPRLQPAQIIAVLLANVDRILASVRIFDKTNEQR